MNASIEIAQETTGKLTAKQLFKIVEQAHDGMYVHGATLVGRPSYSDAFVFTLTAVVSRRISGSQSEVVTKVDVPGWVGNGSTSKREDRRVLGDRVVSYVEAYRPTRGYWSLGYSERLRDALRLLPPDAEVALQVALDAGTNEYLTRAECEMNFGRESGMHADHLYLVASWTRRGKQHDAKVMLDVSVGPHNSARFGQGG